MTSRKPFLPASKKILVPAPLATALQEDVICDRLYLTGLSYYGIEEQFTRPKHSDPQDNIFFYLRQGRGSITAYGNYKRIQAGQYFMIPVGEEFSYTPSRSESGEIIVLRFRGTMTGEIMRKSVRHAVTLLGSERRELDRLLLQLFNCLERGFSIDTMHYATCIFSYTLANLFYGRSATGDEEDVPINSGAMVVEVATQYMRDHLEHRLRLEEIAAHAGYTPTYFSSLFRRKTGYSPITYFNIMKMQRACELLTTTRMRILDICAQLGFEDNYYFSRLFTKTIGMSPKMYRKTHTPGKAN